MYLAVIIDRASFLALLHTYILLLQRLSSSQSYLCFIRYAGALASFGRFASGLQLGRGELRFGGDEC